jgi:hypothetical protein
MLFSGCRTIRGSPLPTPQSGACQRVTRVTACDREIRCGHNHIVVIDDDEMPDAAISASSSATNRTLFQPNLAVYFLVFLADRLIAISVLHFV